MAERLTDERRHRAARQHAADRRDPGGADHHLRPDLRRAFQSGRDAGLRAAPRDRRRARALPMSPAQIVGGIAGTLLAHAMFELPIVAALAQGAHRRRPMARRSGRHLRPDRDHPRRHALRAATRSPWLVGLYITAAYWFTASTSFANPAVAIARAFSDTFAGHPPDRSAGLHRRRARRRARCAGAGGLAARGTASRSPAARRLSNDRHDLPQPRLRHVAQHAGDDPPDRRRARDHRIPEEAADRASGWSN